MEVPSVTMDMLWRVALGAVPLVALVWIACRALPLRSSTRHALWVVVLGVLLAAPLIPAAALRAWIVDALPESRPPAAPALSTPRGAPPMSPSAAAPARDASLRREASPRREPTPASAPAPVTRERAIASAPPGEPFVGPLPEAQPRRTERHAERASSATPARRARDREPQVSRNALAASPWFGFGRVVYHTPAPSEDSTDEIPPKQEVAATPPVPSAVEAAAPPPPALAAAAALPDAAPAPDSALVTWRSSLSRVRDAVLAIPSPPPSIWWLGGAAIVGIIVVHTGYCRWRLRSAYPAPEAVVRVVAAASEAMGLRRAPLTMMVRDRVSPMICCGVRTRLVLPAELWEDLDAVGRKAVVQHELAHLRRRDHWVCWLELLATIVYWWHPLVWWVRKHLREEADLCCDAWVTALMPRERRAYAEALLNTQRYLKGSYSRPVNGLGVISAGKSGFARRLTMVMTQRTRPNRSFTGMGLAGLIAAAGLLSAPLLACPPEELAAKEKAAAERAAAAGQRASEAGQRAALAAERAASAGQRAESSLRRSAERDAAMAAAERARADAMNKLGGLYRASPDGVARALVAPRAPQPPQPPQPPKAPKAPKPPKAPKAPMPPAAALAPMAPGDEGTFERHLRERELAAAADARAQRAPQPARARSGQSDDVGSRLDRLERSMEQLERRLERISEKLDRRSEGTLFERVPKQSPLADNGVEVIRSYTLPEGVREQVWELMSRADVPVRVSQGDDGISVHGPEAQQRVFREFVRLIQPGVEQAPVAALASPEATLFSRVQGVPGLTGTLKASALADEAVAYSRSASEMAAQTQELTRLAEVLKAAAAGAKGSGDDDAREELESKLEDIQERISEMKDRAAELNERARELQERVRSGGDSEESEEATPVAALAPVEGVCTTTTSISPVAVVGAPARPVTTTTVTVSPSVVRPTPVTVVSPATPSVPATPALAPAPVVVTTPLPTPVPASAPTPSPRR